MVPLASGVLVLGMVLGFILWIAPHLDTTPSQRRHTTRSEADVPPLRPLAVPDEKWRIAYYQGGDYVSYTGKLRALAASLAELGWIAPLDLPVFDTSEDTAALWQYLAQNVESDYLEFAADAFWSAGWDPAARSVTREAAIDRLAQGEDIDIIIAIGTWAGQDLVNNAHAVPTIAVSSSDPIQAGIITSPTDSGYDHVLVEIDPERYRRQIRFFHDVVGFERLGVVYEDSQDGRIFGNIADLEHVVAERGFELIRCHAPDMGVDVATARAGLEHCYHEIAPRIDALWIGAHNGEQPEFMPGILAPMFESRVPTWAQMGPDAVQRGAMVSIKASDYEASGRWYAEKVGQILNGARPRDLNQVFETPDRVVINAETARRIGFPVPRGVLSIADEVYTEIEGE